ncbi:hypothetical protein SAMN02982927_01908 [Sporolactobacillus nakayamae]|uniref:Uncharacterized protein n=1 Tax=Sporolactobacillus nakayamae TaxID=269670 RepID=A0A1I2SB23_9BACL|nr:hypothetical protein SAMN02982927_01908 [Sporolactobacillus nakayamae]
MRRVCVDFSKARSELKKINPENKFTAMLKAAAIITKVLDEVRL